jgi:VIT1/CCC1 family predicted Fe2+/Mn2+ transporter
MLFVIPVLLLELTGAIIASVGFGMLLLAILSYRIAKRNKEKVLDVISEHMLIGAVVVVVTFYVGEWVALFFR